MEDKLEENYREELEKLLLAKDYRTLRKKMEDMNVVDIAFAMDEMDDEDSLKLFRILPKDMAADVFAELELDDQQYIIASMSDTEASHIIDNLMADDATDLLEEMPANVVKKILAKASPETRADINHLLRYPEHSAGSIMTVEFIDLREMMTVEDAILKIKRRGLDSETVNICYVVDNQRVLKGTVALRYLLLREPDELIGDIMNTKVISINTHTDQEEAALTIQKYGFTAMPVDDVVDILQEEATEDIEKMAAILPSDKPYYKMTTWETYKKRMPWLLFLMISATFTGAIITGYEDALASYVILTAYIPMLMDTGGNAGSQASVSVIRGLSLGEIEFSEIFKVIWKEIRVAVLCGVTLAGANFIKLLVIDKLALPVAFVICATLIVVVIFAKFIGCVLPLVAEKVGFDPAVMASPLITTIVDAVSLTVYFTIAVSVLHINV